jgi:uncharacterized membrane protein
MKRLITLIFSAALLSPIGASAQTTTTPSIHGQLHFSGLLNVNPLYSSLMMNYNNSSCNQITDLRFNIEAPNNSTPIKGVTGYFSCSGGVWGPFSGALIGTTAIISNGTIVNNLPNIAVGPTSGFTGTFTFGFTQMTCNFDGNFLQGYCELFAVNVTNTVQGLVSGLLGIGNGSFLYTPAP